MVTDDFGEQFEDQMEALDYYFHRKVRGARIADDIEVLKQDLIQDTALAVLTKLQNEKYNDYNINALIWTKAKDVWISYRRSLRKALPIAMQVEEIQPPLKAHDLQLQYENADFLSSIRAAGGEDLLSWRMLVLHIGGYQYKEIAEVFHSTEAAVKVAVNRFRKRLKEL